jgi:hypothetical protein
MCTENLQDMLNPWKKKSIGGSMGKGDVASK